MQVRSSGFPLFEKAKRQGVLDDGNALIVAPTATGKSYIGRTILRRALRRGERGIHAYLVPYRALAAEIYGSFRTELEQDCAHATVKVATGDHNDPFYPQETDILVATYERFAGLLPTQDLTLGRVVVDEVHLVADETRGPVLEGLLARLKSHKRPTSLCALSATVSNPEKLASWLHVPLILGEAADRMVEVEFSCEVTPDLDGKLSELLTILRGGEQAIIFCHSKLASQRLARDLKPQVAKCLNVDDERALREVALSVAEDDEEARELIELLSGGIAFHHAGLSRESRKAVETAFRERHLKAIVCTPTLAAGVNLPARLVVVRDVFRTEFVRGYPQRVLLSTGELLNMLGRAGRPGQVKRGRGIALIENNALDKDDLQVLQTAIQNGRGNPVTSRLADSFDALMRFLVAVAADRGEVTRSDLAEAVMKTLWHHERPQTIEFNRPFREDIMEDIPAYSRVTRDMQVERAWAVADGVAGTVVSGANNYNFSLRFSRLDCTCPARAQWRRKEVCKHLACAIHALLFGRQTDPELRSRALYACAHRFRHTLDLGTKVEQAINLLVEWGLLERVPGGYQATAVGTLAAGSSLDLLLIRTARDRLRKCRELPTIKDVACWVVTDYFSDEAKRQRWLEAIPAWLGEVDTKRIRLPEKFRGDFERGLEDLGQVAMLYAEIAESIARPDVANVCRTTRGCLVYGVAPELIPLAALRIPQLGRARCRFLHDQRGIKTLDELASANPDRLAGPRAPAALTRQWVESARRIQAGRRRIVDASVPIRTQEIDEFLAEFKVDQLALFSEQGLVA